MKQQLSPTIIAAPPVASGAVSGGPALDEPQSASIAVLPFTDLSPDGDQEYFSDGIAEEILNALVQVDELKIASRTSSFQFKHREALGVPAIASELKVRHILSGSVRKAGEEFRITAQLVDARDDRQLWSKSYDRTLSVQNLFAVQDEIAEEIVSVLGVRFGNEERAGIDLVADTQNLDAYELYLEAHNRFIERGPPDYFRETISMFERVTQLDPDFARGWAGLSGAASIAAARGVNDRDYWVITRDSANRAIALNPELSLPYAALGRLEDKKQSPDRGAAQKLYRKAIENDPRNATAFHWLSYSLLGLGYADQAIEYSERCLELDPDYANCIGNLAAAYFICGEAEKGLTYFRQNLLAGVYYIDYSYLYFLAQSDREIALLSNLGGYLQINDGPRWLVEPLFRALTEDDYDKAEGLRQISARLESESIEWTEEDALYEFVHFILGAYDDLIVFDGNVIWGSLVPDYVRSPARKRLFREAGLPAYWREHGYPPQCRAVGDDDFECD